VAARLPSIACVAALALLLPPVLAEAPLATGTSRDVLALPAAGMDASLRGYVADGADCPEMTVAGTALRAHLENDTLVQGLTVAGQQPRPGSAHAAFDYTLATVAAHLRHADLCRIMVLPLAAGAVVEAPATRLAPRDGSPARHQSMGTPDRADTTLDPTLSIAADVAGPLRLRGDLRLVLWEAELTVQDADRTTTLDTGAHGDPVAAAPQLPVRTNARQTEAYLDLYGANLTLAGASLQLLVDRATLRADAGELLLDGAALTVAGTSVAGSQVRLAAPARLHADRGGAELGVTVAGAGALEVDGRAVRLDGGLAKAPALAWLLAVALVGIPVLLAWRLKGAARELSGTERYATAAAVASSVAWIPLVGRHERVIQVVSLLKLERFAEAERLLGRSLRWRSLRWRSHGPTWDFLMAHLCAQTGRHEEAVRHLSACLGADPSYATDARAAPALRPIVEEARARARAGAGHPEGYA
jgi:hypothetical protein